MMEPSLEVMTSSLVAVEKHLAHRVSLRDDLSPAAVSMARPRLYRVAKARSTTPFFCGVLGAVNSKMRPRPLDSAVFWKARFSPALTGGLYGECSYAPLVLQENVGQ